MLRLPHQLQRTRPPVPKRDVERSCPPYAFAQVAHYMHLCLPPRCFRRLEAINRHMHEVNYMYIYMYMCVMCVCICSCVCVCVCACVCVCMSCIRDAFSLLRLGSVRVNNLLTVKPGILIVKYWNTSNASGSCGTTISYHSHNKSLFCMHDQSHATICVQEKGQSGAFLDIYISSNISSMQVNTSNMQIKPVMQVNTSNMQVI